MTGDGKSEAGRGNERAGWVRNYLRNEFKKHGVGMAVEGVHRTEARCSESLAQSEERGRHYTGAFEDGPLGQTAGSAAHWLCDRGQIT